MLRQHLPYQAFRLSEGIFIKKSFNVILPAGDLACFIQVVSAQYTPELFIGFPPLTTDDGGNVFISAYLPQRQKELDAE